MVTRDPGIAAEAVHDALVASTALADRARHSERLVWLLALTRTECVRQLRARTVFIDTALPVTPFADPFDVLTPGDRDALCLMRRSDLTAGEGARAMGCREPIFPIPPQWRSSRLRRTRSLSSASLRVRQSRSRLTFLTGSALRLFAPRWRWRAGG